MTEDRHQGHDDSGKLLNLARGAKAAALLCFLLPWVTVSCSGRPVLSVSGADLARGHVGEIENVPLPAWMGDPLEAVRRHAEPDWLIAIAALLIVLGLAATFLRPRARGAFVGAGAAAAAAVLIAYDVLVRLPALAAAVRERVSAETSGGGGSGIERILLKEVASMADVSGRPGIGLGLTLAALIAAAVLLKIVHGRRRGAP
ncbi:MAG TPA: hypothetical protein VGB79_13955 [Allosphingosinicella sp.]|jgi:hypothetical protein